jgi:hypothetical protein
MNCSAINSTSDVDAAGSCPAAVNSRVIRPRVQISIPCQALHSTLKESGGCLGAISQIIADRDTQSKSAGAVPIVPVMPVIFFLFLKNRQILEKTFNIYCKPLYCPV